MNLPAPNSRDVPEKIVAALDRLGRGVRSHQQSTAAALSLTPLQLNLLQVVADGPPPEPVTGLLATELGVSQPTVTDSLVALERKGHITRHRAPDDRRRAIVELRPSGVEVVEQAHESQRLLRQRLAALPEAEQHTMLITLLELIGTLLDVGVIDVARTCTTCHFYRTPGSGGAPAHCGLLDVPLAPADHRVNCSDHLPRAS